MGERGGLRYRVAAAIQTVEARSVSPADLRARHRRFLENNKRKQKRQQTEPAPPFPNGVEPESPDDTTAAPEDEDEVTTSEDEAEGLEGLEGEDAEEPEDAAQSPTISPDGVFGPGTAIAAPSATNGLPPPPITPSPTPTAGAGRQAVISDASRTLVVNTPITHSSGKGPAQATPQPPVPLIPQLFPSSSSSSSTSSPPGPTISPPTPIIPAAIIPPPTTSPGSTSPFIIGNVAQPENLSSSPTPLPSGLGVNTNKGVMPSTKETNFRTAAIVVGVFVGALALIIISWILIRKKSKSASNKKHIDWLSEKDPVYNVTRPPSSIGGDNLFEPATTVGLNSTTEPQSVAAWPAYDGTRSEAAVPTYYNPPPMPTAYFGQTSEKAPPLPEYRAPPRTHPQEAPNPLEAHPGVLVMGGSPVTPPSGSKWPTWRNSGATVSSLASVPRFRTIKSWVGDQRSRAQRQGGEEVPNVPDVPERRYSRLE